MILDHYQVLRARTDLGISQTELAHGTGINRTVLSGFETGQLALRDEWARKLVEFFASRGVSLNHKPRLMNDLVVSRGLSEGVVQRVLAELHSVEQRIHELEPATYKKGLLGSFLEEGKKERQELLALSARWRCLVLKLQGKRVPEPIAKARIPATQGEWLGQIFHELSDEGSNKTLWLGLE